MILSQLNFTVQLLLESKDMLDISIENADKVKNKEKFLNNTYKVEEKFDGVKLTIWRNNEEWSDDYEKNWVVAFKNQVLYGSEFESVDRNKTKKHSVGISQYAFVHDHLKSIHKNTKSIPKNTEIFCEFIQNKLTTTRDYKNKHGMYIIAYSPATGEVDGGMLKTKPTGFFQDDIENYAKILKLNLPPVVFQGKLDSVSNISKGILNDKLKNAWENNKEDYESNPYESVKKTFLEFESELGGKTEGVVLHTIEDGKIFKFVQDDQYNKDVRFAKKVKYQSNDPAVESDYWDTINKLSGSIVDNLSYEFSHLEYKDILNQYNTQINAMSDSEIEKLFATKFKAMRDEGKME
jgi:hypothetical protein